MSLSFHELKAWAIRSVAEQQENWSRFLPKRLRCLTEFTALAKKSWIRINLSFFFEWNINLSFSRVGISLRLDIVVIYPSYHMIVALSLKDLEYRSLWNPINLSFDQYSFELQTIQRYHSPAEYLETLQLLPSRCQTQESKQMRLEKSKSLQMYIGALKHNDHWGTLT